MPTEQFPETEHHRKYITIPAIYSDAIMLTQVRPSTKRYTQNRKLTKTKGTP